MPGLGSILILGAGATGLGAAYRLQQFGYANWHILERSYRAGGLASSVLDAHGFVWDLGGHVQFSHYKEYDEMLEHTLGDRRLWHERSAWIWLNNKAVPYPLQYNLNILDDEEREAAIDGLEKATLENARHSVSRSNFRDWIDQTFGRWIADNFMLPYNTKVWGYPLDMLSATWIGERVAIPDLKQVRQGDMKWGPNRRFCYPREGGTGAIWDGLAATFDSRVEFGISVLAVNLLEHTVSLSDGRNLQWDTLISSLPLDQFCSLCIDLDSDVRKAACSLKHSSCHFLGIGLHGEPPAFARNASWIYFPSPHSPYYRVSVISNYSPRNAPQGCWSLLAEVCETPYYPVRAISLENDVISSLQNDHLVPRGTPVISIWHRREEYGYPTPSLNRDAILALVLPALEKHQVYSRGRFGAWKYEVSNQDHSFMQGFELINRLFEQGQEVTLITPDMINRGR